MTTHESGGGAGDGLSRPLTLGLNTEMSTDLLKSGFYLPTAQEIGEGVSRSEGGVGGQEGLRGEFTSDVADEDIAEGNMR